MKRESVVHGHPLSLCEKHSVNGKLICPACSDPSFGDGYSCTNCQFSPIKCRACGESLSGNLYFCEQCLPTKGALFHESCVDLPEEIQIDHRPGCLLRITVCRRMDRMICRYCDYVKKLKYRCGDCDFEICHKCALELIKYHQGQPQLKHFSHQHPLTTLLKLDFEMGECKLCFKTVSDDHGYGCVPCKFYIHSSCGDELLLQEIRHPFHPPHPITLSFDTWRLAGCAACGNMIQGIYYQCGSCMFYLHRECCLYPKPKIKYSGHQHLLSHIFLEDSRNNGRCAACGSEIIDFSWMRCVECNLDFHVQCAVADGANSCKYTAHVPSAGTLVNCDGKDKFRHFSLKWEVMTLQDQRKYDHSQCVVCNKNTPGLAYINYYDSEERVLHKSCAELLRQIHHQSHDHYLTLDGEGKQICDACHNTSSGFKYNCARCKFSLDLDCASNHPSIHLNPEGQDWIGHFGHEHHLIISKVACESCKICYKIINGQCYGCAECKFYIHVPCAELPIHVEHAFHPKHVLTLLVTEKSEFICDACCFDGEGFCYRCNYCNFNIHLDCMPTKATIDYRGHQDHLLIQVNNMTYQGECNACCFEIEGESFLRCVECRLNFHVQCDPLPLQQTIQLTQQQHDHLITMKTKSAVGCSSAVQVDEIEKIKHFGHKHSLYFFDNKRNDDPSCHACEKKVLQTDPAYGCEPCKYYLHKRCAELPREKIHPFHLHTLTIRDCNIGEHVKCNACQKLHRGFSYSCKKCAFNIDVDCSSLFPSIKLESDIHPHTLTYFKKLYGPPKCAHCKFIPPDKLSPLDDIYVSCVKCNFNLHLLCCPLPETIEHDCHPHSLILKDNYVDLYVGFEDEEFCCDLCEDRQNARRCVYHCEECNFVVDLEHCLFPQVMQFIEGNRKGIKSRIVSRVRKGFTYKAMVESLSEEEMKSLMEVKHKIVEGIDHLLDTFDELKNISELAKVRITQAFSDNENDDMFLKFAGSEMMSEIEAFEGQKVESELERVGDYKIIPELAPVLETLLESKYGDPGDSCQLTQSVKSILIVPLCVVIKEMRDTDLESLDDDSIVWWWSWLKLVQRAGLRVDFALDHLIRIADIHYFAIANKSLISTSPFYKVHQKIAELSKKIDERKNQIDELKKQAQDILSSYGTEQTRSEAARINETLGLMWKKVTTGFLDDTAKS